MRKLFIFSIVLAGIAIMVGCKKEQDGVSLKAVISNESKAYIGRKYPLSNISGTFARINNVQSEAPFCAVFPANIVQPATSIAITSDGAETNPTYSATATIYLDPHQEYKDENGYQKLDMPMAALTTGTTLYFKNFCSVIRVKVTNSLGSDDQGFDEGLDFRRSGQRETDIQVQHLPPSERRQWQLLQTTWKDRCHLGSPLR